MAFSLTYLRRNVFALNMYFGILTCPNAVRKEYDEGRGVKTSGNGNGRKEGSEGVKEGRKEGRKER